MASLRNRTISGLLWSFIDNFVVQGITFIVGIILARLLTPKEFGLIGMITVFIAVSTSFINSGFGTALIRKKDCTDEDFSTVFYFNMIAGILFYTVLFISATAISNFFNEPELKPLVQILGLVLIIDAFTIIQRTILTKHINFRLQAKISVIASIISGIIGLSMAYTGFGVWSLVAKQLSQQTTNSVLLWLWNKWRPMLKFSKKSFISLFSFGYKLLISGLLDTFYRNLYILIIGKFFSAQELGYFTRANQFQELPSTNINGIISRVTFPVLAEMQDDKIKLKEGYKKIIKSTMLITFFLMLGLAAIAEPMILSLIGDKWYSSVIYLQLLCFVGMMYPLHALNLNILNVHGRSDLFLKLEIVKKIMAVPVIIIGIFWGIKIMIAGMILNSFIAYYINSYWSGKFIDYPITEQLADILPSFLLALINGIIVFALSVILPFGHFPTLFIQLIAGGVLTFLLCELLKPDAYLVIKEIVVSKYKSYRNGRK